MDHPWLEQIQIEDLPEEFRDLTLEIEKEVSPQLPSEQKKLAGSIALAAMLKIMKYFEGDEPYFPYFNGTKFLPARNAVIRMQWAKEKTTYGTVDTRRLAQKHDITVRRLRSIVNDHEDQQDLFPTD
jgi:hypothetical protein